MATTCRQLVQRQSGSSGLPVQLVHKHQDRGDQRDESRGPYHNLGGLSAFPHARVGGRATGAEVGTAITYRERANLGIAPPLGTNWGGLSLRTAFQRIATPAEDVDGVARSSAGHHRCTNSRSRELLQLHFPDGRIACGHGHRTIGCNARGHGDGTERLPHDDCVHRATDRTRLWLLHDHRGERDVYRPDRGNALLGDGERHSGIRVRRRKL